MRRQHEVLFDGTAARPWNRMLFAVQSSAASVPVVPESTATEPKRFVSYRLKRATALRGVWFTANEAAFAANITHSQASSCLTNCVIAGEAEADKSQHRHRYRWKV